MQRFASGRRKFPGGAGGWSAHELVDGGGEKREVECAVRGDGSPERSRKAAAEGEHAGHASEQQDGERGRAETQMKAGLIAPQAVQGKVDEAEEDRIDDGGDGGVESLRKRLLDEAAEDHLLADGVEEQGGQRVEREEADGRHEPAHFIDVKVGADAGAPVIRRVAVESHAEGKEGQSVDGAGEGAEQQGLGAQAAGGEADSATPCRGKENERRSPHGHSLQKEELLQGVGAEESKETDQCDGQVEDQGHDPWRADKTGPEGFEQNGFRGG